MPIERVQTSLVKLQKYNCTTTPLAVQTQLNFTTSLVNSLNKHLLTLFLSACFVQLTAQVNPTPASERIKVIDQRKLAEQKSMVKDIAFQSVGPSIMSGRVTDVDVNENDATEFYVAYATGGLWHTTNNGQSFIPVFDNADVIGIGDIAVNWKTRTIWVGTGEVNSSRSSYAGMGVYKSNDNGKNWEWLGLPASHHIGKIQLHPADNNTAWVAVLGHLYSSSKERGVYKTTDGGKTWKQTLFITEYTGVADIAINPLDPLEIYATAWYRTRSAWNFEESGKSSGIYKSNDGGETWKLITLDKSGFPAGDNTGRIGIAVYPKNPKIIYAVVDNQQPRPDTARKDTAVYRLNELLELNKEQFSKLDNRKLDTLLKRNRLTPRYNARLVKEMVASNTFKPSVFFDFLYVNTGFESTPVGCEVYRSDDAGTSWKKTNQKEISIYNTYGYYFGKIYVSPYNENKLYILGFYAQLSRDGGKTFKTIDKGNVHADHHALWINPKRDSHLINGNDGGLNITYDDGGSWFKANAPAVGQFYAITVDNAIPYNIYGGLQDNGTWMGSSKPVNNDYMSTRSESYVYELIGGGDGMQVQVDNRDNQTIYSGFQFGFYTRQNRQKKESKTIRPRHELGEMPLRFNWQTPILLSRHNQDILYFGSNRFSRSLSKGDSMQILSADLTNGRKEGNVPYGTITAIAESPLKFGLLYAGTDDGNIHLSMDGGYSWKNISQQLLKNHSKQVLPAGLWVSRIVASRYKEGRTYVTLNGYRNDHFLPYLFVSNDYGSTWKQLGRDLPFEPLNVVCEDPKSDSILYVGTDGGLYTSVDAGNSFMLWNRGLPKSIPVHDIAIQERENEIVLGTHGRSLYISSLDSVQLLVKNPDYHQKKQSEVSRLVAISSGDQNKLTREGIDIDCPPVKKSKTKNKLVKIN
ncbi:MAG: glycosyl hydrolase [Chitinophagaceae bacterium]|nr:glycosyl hydrolase [Chitinophagaceae bacterium]